MAHRMCRTCFALQPSLWVVWRRPRRPPRARATPSAQSQRVRVCTARSVHTSRSISLSAHARLARVSVSRVARPPAPAATLRLFGEMDFGLSLFAVWRKSSLLINTLKSATLRTCSTGDSGRSRIVPPSPRPLSSVTYSVPTGPGPSLTWPALASTAGSAHAGSRSGAGLGRPWPPLASTAAAALGWPLS